MNRISPGLKVSQALQGFLQAKAAEAVSRRTLDSYTYLLTQWMGFAGDVAVDKVTTADLRAYLAYLRTDYIPRRFNGKTTPLSPKSLRNVHIALCSFFTWLQREFELPSPMKAVAAPEYETPEVEPFSQAQVEALLRAAEYCKESTPVNRQRFVARRPTGLRDKAVILVLLDTGLRASEFCALNVGDVDMKSGKVTVKHGPEGGAKGGKGRFVYLGKAARRALWRYQVAREDGADPLAPLFLGRGRRMGRDTLRQVLDSLGKKAQVQRCHPHRFRHTFAITFLRSGGDVFSLQKLLGHQSLEISQHYARLAQVDIEQAHRKASPADNWRL